MILTDCQPPHLKPFYQYAALKMLYCTRTSVCHIPNTSSSSYVIITYTTTQRISASCPQFFRGQITSRARSRPAPLVTGCYCLSLHHPARAIISHPLNRVNDTRRYLRDHMANMCRVDKFRRHAFFWLSDGSPGVALRSSPSLICDSVWNR